MGGKNFFKGLEFPLMLPKTRIGCGTRENEEGWILLSKNKKIKKKKGALYFYLILTIKSGRQVKLQ